MAYFSQITLPQVTGSLVDVAFSGSTSAAGLPNAALETDLAGLLGEMAGAIGRISGKNSTGVNGFTNQALGTFSANLVPDAVGGRDLGSTSAEWGDLFIADDKKIQLGSEQDFTMEYDENGDNVAQFAGANMRLGHGAATELQFRDAGLKIFSSADGQLDIYSDVELELSASKIDVNASSDWNISGGATSVITTTAGNLIVDAAAGQVTVDGNSGVLILGNAAEVDITTSAAVDINSGAGSWDASTLSLDATDNSNLTVTAAAKSLVLAAAGGGAQKLQLDSAGTGTDAVDISASAGGVDIDAQLILALDGAGGINIGTAASVAVDFNASTLDIDSTGAMTLDSAAGISLDAAAASNLTVSAGGLTIDSAGDAALFRVQSDAAAEDLTIQQTGAVDAGILITAAGTGADAIKLGASAGGIDVDVALGFDLDAAGAVALDSSAASITMGAVLADGQTVKVGKAGASQLSLEPHGTAASEKASLIVTAGTAADAILLSAVAGGIDVDAGTSFDLDAAGAVSLDSVAGSMTMGAILADGQTLALGKSGAVDMVLSPHGTPASEKFLLTNTAGTGADAIKLNAVAGGVQVAVPDGKGISLGLAGAVEVLIEPHSNAFSERYTVVNTSGTSTEAVVLKSLAGTAAMSGTVGVALSGSLMHFSVADSYKMAGDRMGFATDGEFNTFVAKALFSDSTTVIGALNALAGAASGGVKGLSVITSSIAANTSFTLNDAALVDRTGYDENGISLVEVSVANTDVFVNGQLLASGSSTSNGDYIVHSAANPGILRFAFQLVPDDVIIVKTTAQQ